MVRSSFGKVFLLALSTAIGGFGVVACSSNSSDLDGGARDGAHGSVGLRLQPVTGVDVEVINYTVTQGNAPGAAVIKSGSIPVPGDAPSFSLSLTLPNGTGYYLNLTGESTSRNATCAGGFGPFNISANRSTDITPDLSCIDITGGQSDAQFQIINTACPDLSFDHVVVTPDSASVGSSMALFSNAASASGKPVSYLWQIASPIGPITAPTSNNTALLCQNVGSGVVLTVTASNGECGKSASTKISCSSLEPCGNGVIDAGETCDKALDPTCPADCSQICGDGLVEGSEQCEPPNTATCGASCQPRGACGDGFITAPEQCDPSATPPVPPGSPAGSSCSAACRFLSPPICVCGDGLVCAPNETCDPPFSANNCGGLTPGAPADATLPCMAIESPACLSCVQTTGLDAFDCGTLTGNAVSGPAAGQSRKSLCYKLLDCMYDTNCAAFDSLDCYCGNSGAACQTGGANGKCRAEVEASLESAAFGDIAARLGDPSYAGGTAIVRIDGAKSTCGSICGTL